VLPPRPRPLPSLNDFAMLRKESGSSVCQYWLTELQLPLQGTHFQEGTAETADLSTALRFGRDDKGERRRFQTEWLLSRSVFPQLLSMKAPPSPLSSRPKRSAVERSAVSAVPSWKCCQKELTGRRLWRAGSRRHRPIALGIRRCSRQCSSDCLRRHHKPSPILREKDS
jgi:hypothetical protein